MERKPVQVAAIVRLRYCSGPALTWRGCTPEGKTPKEVILWLEALPRG